LYFQLLHVCYLLHEYLLLKLSYNSHSLALALLKHCHDGSRRFCISAGLAAGLVYREYRSELIWYVPMITSAEWIGWKSSPSSSCPRL
jgi:hypothetical protein